METRLRNITLLLLLSSLWGATFVWVKIALEIFEPLFISWIRIALGAAILLSLSIFSGLSIPKKGSNWLRLGAIAMFNNAIPFTLIAFGEQVVESSTASLIMAFVPIFALITSHLVLTDERADSPKIVGVFVGLAGAILIIGYEAIYNLGEDILAQIAIGLAALCYPISAVLTRGLTERIHPFSLAALSLTAGALFLSPVLLITNLPSALTFAPTTSLLCLAILGTAVAQLIRFQLLATSTISFLSYSGYLVPVFGIIWSITFLSESMPHMFWFALLLIIAGGLIGKFDSQQLKSAEK